MLRGRREYAVNQYLNPIQAAGFREHKEPPLSIIGLGVIASGEVGVWMLPPDRR